MPNLDGTGPRGMGTLGLGRGMGRGRRNLFCIFRGANQGRNIGGGLKKSFFGCWPNLRLFGQRCVRNVTIKQLDNNGKKGI